MKHFIWRLAHNSLPLRQNIKRRGVKLDTICPMCHRLDEDGGHLFLKCKCVRQLWRALDLEEARLLLVNCTSAKHLLEEIWKLDDEQQIEILTLLWVWWSTRNKVSQGECSFILDDVIFFYRNHLRDFKDCMNKGNKHDHSPTLSLWRPPEGDFLKINVDGSFCEKTGSGGWGAVARDCEGRPRMMAAGKLQNLQDPVQAELMAVTNALKIATDLGMGKIILETDCQNIKTFLLEEEMDNGINAVVVREARMLLFLNFDVYHVMYCPRGCKDSPNPDSIMESKPSIYCVLLMW